MEGNTLMARWGVGAVGECAPGSRPAPTPRRGLHLEEAERKRGPCCFNLAACTGPELSKNAKPINAR
jgi:hypothetical protein